MSLRPAWITPMRLLALTVGFSGCVMLAAGILANSRENPESFASGGLHFDITYRQGPEGWFADIYASNGEPATTIAGSADTLCEPLRLLILDADRDGHDDLYIEACDGHGFVRVHEGVLQSINLGQYGPESRPWRNSWWSRQVYDGGFHLALVGCALVLIAMIAAAGCKWHGSRQIN